MAAPLHVVVLAAGEGTRLRGRQAKVLTPLWGRPSLLWTLAAATGLQAASTLVVGGRAREQSLAALLDQADPGDLGEQGVGQARLVIQEQQLGTGHAVLAAAPALAAAEGHLLVLYGDGPLVTPRLLEALLAEHRANDAALTMVSVIMDQPRGYGRVLRDDRGSVLAVVEERDADVTSRALHEVNAGIWVFDLRPGLARLSGVGHDNAQGEVYLTDLVAATVAAGDRVAALAWDRPEDVLGFNDQTELARVRGLLHRRIVADLLASGVEIVDPASTFVDVTASIEPGARLLPCTVIEGKVKVAAGCEVGPFARLRNGTELEPGAEVGNFTETKQTVLGAGSKAKHLTYLGDATIGSGTNIGAGTITANYDGRDKHPTRIGSGAFIGSGTVLVAPSSVEDGATTGAGAIVTAGSRLARGSVWVGVPARPMAAKTQPSDGETTADTTADTTEGDPETC